MLGLEEGWRQWLVVVAYQERDVKLRLRGKHLYVVYAALRSSGAIVMEVPCDKANIRLVLVCDDDVRFEGLEGVDENNLSCLAGFRSGQVAVFLRRTRCLCCCPGYC
jgi:hypothetical protein